jgi:acyl-CoA reductase-like NAD-dependent aldehyde dehydrogenase
MVNMSLCLLLIAKIKRRGNLIAPWQSPPGAEKIDIAAEIDAARNAILAMSPEERASHLKRTAERMQEWPRKIGAGPGHHAIWALPCR